MKAEPDLEFTIDHGTYDPDIHLPKNYGIIRQPSACEENIDLLLAIKSIPGNGARRDGLRESWLDPKIYSGLKVKHVFLFGVKGNCHYPILKRKDSRYTQVKYK